MAEGLLKRGVLAEIVDHKRREVAFRKSLRSLESLRAAATPSARSLERALRAPGARFLLECKKSSPSRGAIRPGASTSEIVAAYADTADALSVLTDTRFFGGRLGDLAVASETAPLPVLQKDFVLDPYQVVEARVHGADAVLLLLSVLDDATARACMAAARELELDCLVEVHDELELERAVKLGARIVGINNRDLVGLRVDLATTERLAPLVPGDRVLVCESGIGGRDDVLRLSPAVDAFLVGSALMGRASVARAARRLVFGRVKVCGLTRPEDAEAAARSGASFGGLVFVEGSSRRVDVAGAAAIVERAAALELPLLGVFADEAPERVAAVAGELGLSGVQLHGAEDAEHVRRLKRSLPEAASIWKAVGVRDAAPVLEPAGVDRFLLDTGDPGDLGDLGNTRSRAAGGTGEVFDWSLVAGLGELPRAVLAGGLRPENAARAAAVGAWALDVSSGVEEAPGRKSRELLERFFEALRPASRRGGPR